MDTGDGLTGFVNPFDGEGNYINKDELSIELITEYLKSEYAGYTEKEYGQMAEKFFYQRQVCLKVLDEFFSRVSDSAENISNPSDLIIIQDICYYKSANPM